MPLKKEPIYIAFIEYLRSYETIRNELEYIFYKRDTTSKLFSAISHNNPTEFFLHIEDSYSTLKEEYKFRFKEICNYFKEKHYYIEDNCTIYLNENELNNLKILNSSVDNYLIESFVIADMIKNFSFHNKNRRLNELIDGISPKDSPVKKFKNISDLHIHLGAGIRIEHRFNFMILNPLRVETQKKPIELFVKLTEYNIDLKTTLLILSMLESYIVYDEVKHIHTLLSIIHNRLFFKIKPIFRTHFFKTIRSTTGDKFSNQILQYAKFAFRNKNIIKGDRYLMVYFMQQILDDKTIPIKKSAIKIYFIFRNMIKTHIVQQHRTMGYGYFSSYSRSTLRRNYLLDEKIDTINSLFRYNGTNIEARITPKETSKEIAKDVKDYILAFEKKRKKKSDIGFGYIFHFIKSRDRGCQNEYFCFRFIKEKKKLRKTLFS